MYKKFLFFSLLFFSFTSVASAQLSIRLSDTKDSFQINPGETFETDLIVKNAYRAPVTVAVYTVDGTTTSSGSFAAKQNTEEQLFFGKWATISENQVTLDKSESKTVKLTISVPDNVTPGDYSGALIISRVSDSQSAISAAESGAAAGLNFTTRLARPVYVSIPGERKSLASIGDLTYQQFAGNQYKIYTELENKGNTTLKFVLATSVKSMHEEARELDSLEIKLFPNSKSSGEISLGQLSYIGAYEINQKITYIEQNLISGAETILGEETRRLSINIIPWTEIIIALILIILLIAVLIWRKVHFKGLVSKSKKYTVKPGDTLMGIAKQNGISWKLLAKINHLKPPYDLQTGKNILIPTKK